MFSPLILTLNCFLLVCLMPKLDKQESFSENVKDSNQTFGIFVVSLKVDQPPRSLCECYLLNLLKGAWVG